MFTLKLTLDTRRKRKDGKYPLVFKLTYKSNTRSIPLKINLLESEWNSRKSTIKSKELKCQYEEMIESFRSKIMTVGMKFHFEKNGIYTVEELKNKVLGLSREQITFKSYWNQELDRLEREKRYGNARISRTSMKVLHRIQNLDIPFVKIDYAFIQRMETVLKARGVKINSISVYLRSMRAIYNSAIKKGLVERKYYPFYEFTIKSERTTPRVLTIKDMQDYWLIDLVEGTPIWDSWNYGRLIFCLRGINFTDLALLTKENLKGSKIQYKRAKTGKVYTIDVVQEAMEIFEYYSCENRSTLLPILSQEEFISISNKRGLLSGRIKSFNKYLRRISKQLELTTEVTSYVFRYTWANIAKELGFSKDLIAEGLGHEYGNKVTGIYLNDFNEEKLNEVNKSIISTISRKKKGDH